MYTDALTLSSSLLPAQLSATQSAVTPLRSTQPPEWFMVSVGRGISLSLLQNTSRGRIVRHSSPGLALCMQNDT